MSERVECYKIGVDCVKNDKEDIKCGGPLYLGFDFYVRKEQLEELSEHIKAEIYAYGMPLIDIYTDDEIYSLDERKVWDKDKISSCIKEYAIDLKNTYHR